MTRHHARAARREREAASVLKTPRVHRKRGESAPDVRPITLANGLVIQPEVKTRARLPHLITRALTQAENYLPGCVGLAMISQTGGRAIVAMYADEFARAVGIAPADLPAQPSLPFGRKGSGQ